MEDRHREIIRKGRVILIQDLSSITELCDRLFSYGVLTEGMVREILEEHGKEPQARKLLDILPRRGQRAFDFFHQSLLETGQQHLADILLPELAHRSKLTKSKTVDETPIDKPPLIRAYSTPTEEISFIHFPDLTQILADVPAFTPENVEPLKVNLKKSNRVDIMNHCQSCYKMESQPRGKLIIINNFEFPKHNMKRNQQCHNLSGTSMQLLFQKLKFKVETYNNIDSKKLLDIITAEKTSNEHYDCFAMMILTHGFEDMVFMTEMEPLKIQNIIDEFDSMQCPKLHGKPKLFFIHACSNQQEPIPPNYLDVISSLLPDTHDESKADIFIARATSYDPIKSGEEFKGFWFLQAFVHIMKFCAHNTHLVDMMEKVNDLAIEDGQLIQFTHTLRKDLFFFPE